MLEIERVCGICGYVSLGGQTPSKPVLARMAATLVHRGPDSEGIRITGIAGLAQRRLAIIDTREIGTAPLSNEDGSIWVALNGEIYNYVELRESLLKAGHAFRTGTDTEVLVHLYEEHGLNGISLLRGMFAFALWDSRLQRLIIARDRVGKKPLYFASVPNAFVFGSEPQAVTAHPDVSADPDFNALLNFLRYQYVPSPATAYAGMQKLEPGHYAVCTGDGQVTVKSYWSPPVRLPASLPAQEFRERMLDTLRDAVRIRMRADVPLGAFLSGGVDSGSIVALMAEMSPTPVKTFSIGFDHSDFDELPYARAVAAMYQTDHHELVVRPHALDDVTALVEHYGEPFADSSALPTFYVSRMAREQVTVALSGDGGDESFSGYTRYGTIASWDRADFLPPTVRAVLGQSAARLGETLLPRNVADRMDRAGAMFAATPEQRYALSMRIIKPQEELQWFTPQFLAMAEVDLVAGRTERLPDESTVDWMMRHDQRFYLPDCLMMKVDIASMANSLEVRSPLLDQEVIALAASVPHSLLRRGNAGKLLFKESVAHLLPQVVMEKRKTGFGVPLADWLRRELRPLLEQCLLDGITVRRGLFVPSAMRRILDEHIQGRRDWSNRLWSLMVLELWFRRYVD